MHVLSNLENLILENNPITFPPNNIMERGTTAILEYLKDFSDGVEVWKQLKVITIGSECVGKVIVN